MKINNIELTNFRNYKSASVNLSDKINIFIGPNGSGKTNILEAIYITSLSKSFRADDVCVIKNDEEFFKVNTKLSYVFGDKELTLITATKGKKASVNGVLQKRMTDFIGNLNVVLFSPNDISDLKSGPQERRKLIDFALYQISKEYLNKSVSFKRQLKLRNEYLKYIYPKVKDNTEIKDEMLDVLTLNFIGENRDISNMRKVFIKRLSDKVNIKYKSLSGSNTEVTISYLTNFKNDIDFFKERYKNDLHYGSTQNGVHRDDLIFLKDGSDFLQKSSQGETRMLALSLKLAIAEIIKEEKGEDPVILLDDVFSELDINHQERLLRLLDSKSQIIITTTDIEKINGLDIKKKIFSVDNNQVKEI